MKTAVRYGLKFLVCVCVMLIVLFSTIRSVSALNWHIWHTSEFTTSAMSLAFIICFTSAVLSGSLVGFYLRLSLLWHVAYAVLGFLSFILISNMAGTDLVHSSFFTNYYEAFGKNLFPYAVLSALLVCFGLGVILARAICKLAINNYWSVIASIITVYLVGMMILLFTYYPVAIAEEQHAEFTHRSIQNLRQALIKANKPSCQKGQAEKAPTIP